MDAIGALMLLAPLAVLWVIIRRGPVRSRLRAGAALVREKLREPVTVRMIALTTLVLAFAAASWVLPLVLDLNRRWGGGFLTGATYGSMLVLLAAGLVMSQADPANAWLWVFILGLFPPVFMAVRMLQQGPGNLWPFAIVLAIAVGWVPALIGAMVGWGVRGVLVWLSGAPPGGRAG